MQNTGSVNQEMADNSNVDRKVSFSHRGSKPPDPPRPHMRVEDEAAVERKYTFGDVLGQGSFGVVKEVTSRATGEQFAVKIVNKDKVGSYNKNVRDACSPRTDFLATNGLHGKYVRYALG